METKKGENKFPIPDYDNIKCIVQITVCENCNKIELKKPHGGVITATYPEIIGAIEITKAHFMREWSDHNKAEFKKQQKKKKPNL